MRLKNILAGLSTAFLIYTSPLNAQFNHENKNNPSLRPNITYSYYGSGDIDKDMSVDSLDVDSIDNTLASQKFIETADLNLDERVDSLDKQILTKKASNGFDWQNLTKEEKIGVIKNMLAIDTTNHKHWGWYCVDYSLQLFLNNFGHDTIPEKYVKPFNGKFNLPVYAAVTPGHGLNAVLVGEDYNKLEDWLFIEPQTDETFFCTDTGLTTKPFFYPYTKPEYLVVEFPSDIDSGGGYSVYARDFSVDFRPEYKPDDAVAVVKTIRPTVYARHGQGNMFDPLGRSITDKILPYGTYILQNNKPTKMINLKQKDF